MRMHWIGVNTAEAKCDLEDTALQCPGVGSTEEEASQGRGRTEGPEQISAQNVGPWNPEGKGERRKHWKEVPRLMRPHLNKAVNLQIRVLREPRAQTA